MTYRNPDYAFAKALYDGKLSTDPLDPTYVGNYMYMGHDGEQAMFKHITTRKYLRS